MTKLNGKMVTGVPVLPEFGTHFVYQLWKFQNIQNYKMAFKTDKSVLNNKDLLNFDRCHFDSSVAKSIFLTVFLVNHCDGSHFKQQAYFQSQISIKFNVFSCKFSFLTQIGPNRAKNWYIPSQKERIKTRDLRNCAYLKMGVCV